MAVTTISIIDLLKDGDMSGSLASPKVVVKYHEASSFQFVWTGAPVGTLDLEVSNDGITWTPAGLVVDDPAGTASDAFMEMDTGALFIRAVFNFTSGTGSLSIHFCGKTL